MSPSCGSQENYSRDDEAAQKQSWPPLSAGGQRRVICQHQFKQNEKKQHHCLKTASIYLKSKYKQTDTKLWHTHLRAERSSTPWWTSWSLCSAPRTSGPPSSVDGPPWPRWRSPSPCGRPPSRGSGTPGCSPPGTRTGSGRRAAWRPDPVCGPPRDRLNETETERGGDDRWHTVSAYVKCQCRLLLKG